MVEALKRLVTEQVELPKTEIKWAEVTLTEVLQRGKRVEGAYFNIEEKRARQALINCGFPLVPLWNDNESYAKNCYYPGRFKRYYFSKGLKFYSSFDCLDFRPRTDNLILLNKFKNIEQFRLQRPGLIITRSGTTGVVGFISETLNGLLASEHAIRVECETDEESAYLYAFLSTSVGKAILKSLQFGSVVSEIEPQHLVHVQVPLINKIDKLKIADKILKAYELMDKANDLLQQADNMFFECLGIKRISKLLAKAFQ